MVDNLRKLIKQEKTPELDDIAADKLQLWQVDASPEKIKNNKYSKDKEIIGFSPVGSFWEDGLLLGHIHVIVARPAVISSKRSLDDFLEYSSKMALVWAEYKKSKHTITAAGEIGDTVIKEAVVDAQYFFNQLSNSSDVSFDTLNLLANLQPKPPTSENNVQSNFVNLFQLLPARFKQWEIRDTSVGYLKDPIGKIGFTIIQGNTVSWAHVVSAIEVKITLSSQTSYHEALGQLVDRFSTIFDLQSNRPFIIGAVCGDAQVEFVWQNRKKVLKRSGILDLSFNSQTAAMDMLLRMVTASQQQLGYQPPQDCITTVSSVSGFTPRTVLRPPVNERQSFVVSGTMNGEDAVIKVSKIEHEVEILKDLAECDFIPKLMDVGKLPKNKEYMVMSPFGEQLEVEKHGWKGVLKAFQDVAQAIKFASEHGILHRDISYGNIVFHEGHGYLIDWGVAARGSPEVRNALTGTILFSSVKVTRHLFYQERFTHTLDDDIESLFYTFIYIACDGAVKWKKGLGYNTVAAMKLYTIMEDFDKQLEYVKNGNLLPYLKSFHNIITSQPKDRQKDINAVINLFEFSR